MVVLELGTDKFLPALPGATGRMLTEYWRQKSCQIVTEIVDAMQINAIFLYMMVEQLGRLDCYERVIQCLWCPSPFITKRWPFDLGFRGREWRQRCKGGTGSVCAANRMNVWKSQFTIVLENHDFLCTIRDWMLYGVMISVCSTLIASASHKKGATYMCNHLRISL